MIDLKNHWKRYEQLFGCVEEEGGPRHRDGGYKAAVYILTADVQLSELAMRAADWEGIDFAKIYRGLKRECYSDTQLTMLRVAADLFNGGKVDGRTATPQEMASCLWGAADVLCTALYLWKGRAAKEGWNGVVCAEETLQEKLARDIEAAQLDD